MTAHGVLPSIRPGAGLADYVIELRKAAFGNLSLNKVAQTIGVHRTTLGRYEKYEKGSGEGGKPQIGYVALLVRTVVSYNTNDERLIEGVRTQALQELRRIIRHFRHDWDEHYESSKYELRAWDDIDRLAETYLAAHSKLSSQRKRTQYGTWAVSTASGSIPLYNLPAPNHIFLGRDLEVSELEALLLTGKSPNTEKPAIVAITGPPGIGKTAVASYFARRNAKDFSGGIFWFDMATREGAATQLAESAGPGGLAVPFYGELSNQHEKIVIVRRGWTEPTPRLLVFDNLEDLHLLDEFGPPVGIGGWRLIITSRRSIWPASRGITLIPLSSLSDAASVELLLSPRAFRLATTAKDLLENAHESERRSLTDISRNLGGLPIALTNMGVLIGTYFSETLASHWEKLRSTLVEPDGHDFLGYISLYEDEEIQADLPPNYVRSLVAAFTTSYQKLDPSKSPDSHALMIWHRAAYCAAAPVPRDLLMRAADLAAQDQESGRVADRALTKLAEHGLMQPLPNNMYQVHRLLSTFARMIAPDTRKDEASFEAALLAEISSINDQEDTPRARQYLSHLQLATERADRRADSTAASLHHHLGVLLHSLGDYSLSEQHLRRALELRKALLPAPSPEIGASLHELGYLMYSRGRYRTAQRYYQKALKIRESVSGYDSSDVADTLGALAVVVKDMGDLNAAKPLYARALEIRKRVLGLMNKDTATSLNDLGVLLLDQDELNQARELLEQSLQIEEAILPADHRNTAATLNNLALVMLDLGDLLTAKELCRRALRLTISRHTLVHPETSRVLSNYGAILLDLGKLRAAEWFLLCALDVTERTLGENHPETAMTLNQVGNVLRARKKYKEALLYHGRALRIKKRKYRGASPETAKSHWHLAGLLFELGRYGDAVCHYREALAMRRATLPRDHREIEENLYALAAALQACGSQDEARGLIVEATRLHEARVVRTTRSNS